MNARSRWPRKPIVYEINTRVWLSDLKDRLGREVTLADVPDEAIRRWKDMGIHAVWLMGVWRTSPFSSALCRASEGINQEARSLLGDVRASDVDASPYAVAGYEIDPVLGGPEAMAVLHGKMRRLGILLVLDFVPNHLAVDHPWTREQPGLFISGTSEQMARDPSLFFSVPETTTILAHGRDPHFPAWSDTVQLNYFNPATHEAMTDELLRIAGQCDGVRCDMAMLLVPEVFKSVWGWAAPDQTPQCFWDKAIGAVRAKDPGFVFMAEVYWGLEGSLQAKGFDYTYDKALYDHVVSKRTDEIHAHLATRSGFHEHAMRFIENHDEPRAAAVFGKAQSQMAAAMALTLPGATLLHQGQEYGWQKRLPVQLRRRPIEPTDRDLEAMYRVLIKLGADPVVQDGKWEMLVVEADRRHDVLAYQWIAPRHEGSLLVVLNLTPRPQTGCARASCLGSHITRVLAEDMIGHKTESRPALVSARVEIPFRLPPWGFRIVRLSIPRHQIGEESRQAQPEETIADIRRRRPRRDKTAVTGQSRGSRERSRNR